MSSTDAPPDEPMSDLVVRRAEPGDAAACADLFTASRLAAGAAFPPSLHSADEDRAFVAVRVGGSEVWVALYDNEPVGYLDLDGAWVHSLYVSPEAQGRGVGSVLLDLAKACRPDGFSLWVFATNEPARRLYRRHSLVELETTDGSGNEERAPDLRMAWPGRAPIACFRSWIDEVDHELAGLVSRRVALTAAVQEYKQLPGRAGRDPHREREIAARLAARTPDLDTDAWTPLVHLLVETGLDAAERRTR